MATRKRSANQAAEPAPSSVAAAASPAAATANPIVTENQKPGNPQSQWDLSGPGSTTIEGFATSISVNHGSSIGFKVNTASTNYRIDIYRLGYYGGMGARLVATLQQNAATVQPAPGGDPSIGLVDAGNWQVSATWAVPADAVSGAYIAKLVRQDGTAGENHIPFVVRDDGTTRDIVFQTSDTTWHAYNGWGGANLYGGNATASSDGRAYKVSYNRPFGTRDGIGTFAGPQDFLFSGEYAAIRWLERNGFDVCYIAGVDTGPGSATLTNHKVFMSVGHDEYWSGDQRTHVEAARDAGVNLLFLSGNEVYWKTRWEPDSNQTPNRTLVCYKETHALAKIDPSSQWTGTWRDPSFSPPSDGGRPENALTGTIFQVDSFRADTITIPFSLCQLRPWRNTAVAETPSGQTASLATGMLGYEWDQSPDNGFRPGGLVHFSSTTLSVNTYLLDYGNTVGPGTATHNLSLYRAPSGAIVFGAGTVFLSFGLDTTHDYANDDPNPIVPTPEDPNVQQALVNLFAEMSVQPQTLQANLVPATQSTDRTPPVSVIAAPSAGASVVQQQMVTISGTASDAAGLVAGVEVSTDGGTTWHAATGTTSWSFTWWPLLSGTSTIKSRAVDDSLNLETPGAGVTVTVTPATAISLFTNGDAPATVLVNDPNAVEVGLKFQTSAAGTVTAIRFYKNPQNIGTHVGNLWSASGTLLASATFTGETASGWQQVNLATPVTLAANTTYVVSYHTSGFYSADLNYFAAARSVGPLTAPNSANAGGNGVYAYGSASSFPTNTFLASNYWVDVVFNPSAATTESLFAPSDTPTTVTVNDANPVELGVKFQTSAAGEVTAVRFYKGPQNTGTHVGNLWNASGTLLASATFAGETASGWQQVSLATPVNLATGTTYVVSYHSNGFYSADANYFASAHTSGSLTAPDSASSGGNGVYTYGSGNSFPANTFSATNYWVDLVFNPSATTQSLFSPSDTPATITVNDANPVELGVKFQAATAGQVTAIRFYKGPQNTGTHVGNLWNGTGALLASATFAGETASGWQQVSLATPVSLAANTTYVVSYHSNGFYSADSNYFASAHTSGSLTAPDSASSGGNGVYTYGSTSSFPTNTFNASNYWVDVVFEA